MKHLLSVAALVGFSAVAAADPNPDIEAYCRSSTTSFVAMRTCVDAERRARNERSCLDALAAWPEDKPCPPAWFRRMVDNLRLGLPCNPNEVKE